MREGRGVTLTEAPYPTRCKACRTEDARVAIIADRDLALSLCHGCTRSLRDQLLKEHPPADDPQWFPFVAARR